MDSQGRIALASERCKRCNYEINMEVAFVPVDKMKYRLVPINKGLAVEEAGYGTITEKYRIVVPAQIRSLYTDSVRVTGNESEGYIYIEFLNLRENRQAFQGLVCDILEQIERLVAKAKE